LLAFLFVMKDASLLDFVSTSALVCTCFFFFSPLAEVMQIRNTGSCGDVQVFNFVSMMNNTLLWCIYATCKGLYFPQLVTNVLGGACALFYLQSYWSNAIGAEREEANSKIGISLCIVVVSALYPITMGVTDTVVRHLGYECIVFNIIMYGAPLSELGTVLSKKSVATMPFAFVIMNQICSCLWFMVGILVQDVPTWGPNVIGISLAFFQLCLFTAFDNDGDNVYGDSAPRKSSGSAQRRMAAPVVACVLAAAYMGHSTGMIHLDGVSTGAGGPNKDMFDAIKALAATRPIKQNLKIAIGWNTNIDLIASAVPVFTKMGVQAGTNPADAGDITSVDQMVNAFQFFFQDSGAAERVVTDPGVFDQVAKAIRSIPTHKVFTGGNAALMGDRFAREGAKVLLGGPMGDDLRKLLKHPNMNLADKAGQKEDAHIILEYEVGQTWGGSTASRNNRFILNQGKDEKISSLSGMEEHLAMLEDFDPHLLVVSGINILGGRDDQDYIDKRMTEVGKGLTSVNSKVPIHLELASMASDDFIRQLVAKLFSESDSIGMNERETLDIFRAMGGDIGSMDTDDLVGKKVGTSLYHAAVPCCYTMLLYHMLLPLYNHYITIITII
jgi:uncharacterized protein with PQ loop repeat